MAYVTIEDIKAYKDISTGDDDALISSLIDRAEAWVNRECRRTLVADADTTRYYDAVDHVRGRDLILDDDLCQITSVTSDGNSLTSTHYTTVPRNDTPWYILRMKRNSAFDFSDYTTDAEDSIVIVGRFGYMAAATEDIKHLIIRLVAYAYTQKDAAVFDTIAIPDAGVITVPSGFPADAERIVKTYRKLSVATGIA